MAKTIVKINYDRIDEIAKRIKGKLNIPLDDFTDPKYYPSKNDEPESVLRYFFFMVAIDHRLSRPNRDYEGIVDGEFFHGADLLYRLGAKKYYEDPKWFTPENMANLTLETVRNWLAVSKPKPVEPPDLEVRLMLLRDAGRKLLKLYDGMVMKIIEESKNYLKALHGGLIDRLKVFRAYEDPVEKKPYLFYKFINRRGLFNPVDKENIEIPVDNHLARIALRLGIVEVEGVLEKKILEKREAEWWEDVVLRVAVRKAYKLLAEKIGVDIVLLDDFLWMFGRTCCLRDKPSCRKCSEKCSKTPWCVNGRCILYDICSAGRGLKPLYYEHMYLNTWYY